MPSPETGMRDPHGGSTAVQEPTRLTLLARLAFAAFSRPAHPDNRHGVANAETGRNLSCRSA
jgi:hypothetical protein